MRRIKARYHFLIRPGSHLIHPDLSPLAAIFSIPPPSHLDFCIKSRHEHCQDISTSMHHCGKASIARQFSTTYGNNYNDPIIPSNQSSSFSNVHNRQPSRHSSNNYNNDNQPSVTYGNPSELLDSIVDDGPQLQMQQVQEEKFQQST